MLLGQRLERKADLYPFSQSVECTQSHRKPIVSASVIFFLVWTLVVALSVQ